MHTSSFWQDAPILLFSFCLRSSYNFSGFAFSGRLMLVENWDILMHEIWLFNFNGFLALHGFTFSKRQDLKFGTECGNYHFFTISNTTQPTKHCFKNVKTQWNWICSHEHSNESDPFSNNNNSTRKRTTFILSHCFTLWFWFL